MASLRGHWARLMGGSLLILAAAHIAPRFLRPPDLDENRRLAEAPAWPSKGLDSLRKETDAWVADHFPPRPLLIGGLNWLRLQAGVSGSPRVIVGRKGWMYFDNGSHMGPARGVPPLADPEARAWLGALAGRTEALERQGIAYLVVVPPEKETLFPQYAPGWFRLDLNRPAVTLSRLAEASGAGDVLYLHGALARQTRWGLKTYVAEETHWTGLGAYLGYAALMRELARRGLAEGPRPLESFTEVRMDEPNKPRNLALMLGVSSFLPIVYPELEDPEAMSRIVVTPLTRDRDWTAPRVVDTGQAGKPVLLMTMDSFSSALLPFLYPHFSRIVIAHNDEGTWREDLIARFKPDIVMLEVLESGLRLSMTPAPPPSAEARARVARIVAAREAYRVRPPARAVRREGGEGDDRLDGGPGRDDLNGREGADTVNGLGDDDVLRGGRGPDRIDGGPGADWLSGGRGDDVLVGGPGPDVFNSFAEAGTDVVTDFSVADGDRIELDAGVAFQVRQEGADTVIVMDRARLVLKGVEASSLPAGAVRNR